MKPSSPFPDSRPQADGAVDESQLLIDDGNESDAPTASPPANNKAVNATGVVSVPTGTLIVLVVFTMCVLLLLFWGAWSWPGRRQVELQNDAESADALNAEAAFWWLNPLLNKWAQARFYHDHLIAKSLLRSPPTTNDSNAQVLSAMADALSRAASPPPPSQYFTQLLYDSMRALPLLPVTPFGTRRISGSLALRHVRLAGGTLYIHLPTAQQMPLSSPQPNSSHYEYDRELELLGHAFEPFDVQRRHWQRVPPSLAAGKSWLNSTRWPIPSVCHRELQNQDVVGETDDANDRSSPSFKSSSCCCRATQWDYPSHSHGRLPYHSDPHDMLASNTRALRSLYQRLQLDRPEDPAVPHPTTAFLNLNAHLDVGLPIELVDGPLDYANENECEQTVDHEYIVAAMFPGNIWHGTIDFSIPLYSLMHDPCFFPVPLEVDLRTGEMVNRSADQQPRSGTSRNRGRVPQMPQSSSCSSNHHPQRDGRILYSKAEDAKTMFEPFFTHHSYQQDRTTNQDLPHLSSLDAVQRLRSSLCIKDVVIGIPWYYHMEHMIFEAVDEVREEWEKFRVDRLMTHIDAELQAPSPSQLSQPSQPADVSANNHTAIHELRFSRRVSTAQVDGVQREENRTELGDKEVPLAVSDLFQEQLPPPYFPYPPSYSAWLHDHNDSSSGTGALTSVRAEPPDALSLNESKALTDSIQYYQRLRENPSLTTLLSPSAPPRLRLLFVRRNTRRLGEQEAVISVARDVGFEVEVRDFTRVDSRETWVQHLNWLRSFHVVLAVHGAGLTNIVGMPPGARSLLVEIFPSCWSYPWYRLAYATKLARHSQVRSFGIITPCPSDDEKLATAEQVKAIFTVLLTYWHDNFIHLPTNTSRFIPVPLVTLD